MRRLSLARRLAAAALACVLAASAALACVLAASAAQASACTLDQRPSASANHQLARVNRQTPTTAAQLATWSLFYFGHAFQARHAITFVENRRELARTLTASALRQPCGWQFGDGHVSYGWTVRHTYAHAGRWPIKVYVWDPASRRWDLFDQVTITVK